MNRNRQLKQDYKLTRRAFGVFLIRNTTNDKVFLASGKDIKGIINRHKFQLNANGHPNIQLQKDWNELGSEKFEFEILDEMEPLNEPSFDVRREVEFMEDMWLEKLAPFGDRGYNVKKLTRDQRLRMISERNVTSRSG